MDFREIWWKQTNIVYEEEVWSMYVYGNNVSSYKHDNNKREGTYLYTYTIQKYSIFIDWNLMVYT